MKIVVFGLTISSSWGNGHATLWRGLSAALAQHHHQLIFFERDAPYYAATRDFCDIPGGALIIYPDWDSIRFRAQKEVRGCDVAIVTSYCPDGLAAGDLILSTACGLRAFYDLDTPITLARISSGETIPYISARGLSDFDLVLSYAGGDSLSHLQSRLGARRVAPLYGHVDPGLHQPVAPRPQYRADLSYLATYSADRQTGVETYFTSPARRRPLMRFVIAGAQYPADFPWEPNIYFVRHLPPGEHAAFYSSSRITLNLTRAPMARSGWCPSSRLFEAAACGTPVLTDNWNGLDYFFTPGSEVLVAQNETDVLIALDLSDEELARIGRAARARATTAHTSKARALEMLAAFEAAARPSPVQ